MIYIGSERLFVSLVLITLIAWGKNEIVVHTAAANPMNVKKFMSVVIYVHYINMFDLEKV